MFNKIRTICSAQDNARKMNTQATCLRRLFTTYICQERVYKLCKNKTKLER